LRADRLIGIMLLLQARGKMTAKALSQELEVSERTIYRDMEALSTAGIPVYALRGPGGGCCMLESYRTSITGLNIDEARAIFMLSSPTPLSDLGVGRELKSAFSKLEAALPVQQRLEGQHMRQRVFLDWSQWGIIKNRLPSLPVIFQAVDQNKVIEISYMLRFETIIERQVTPYGLVAKAGDWYLVCCWDCRVHVIRVAEILSAQLTDERFEYPPDFNLQSFWKVWCENKAIPRPKYSVLARVKQDLIRWLNLYYSDQDMKVIDTSEDGEDQWVSVNFSFDSLVAARERILGFGNAVEILKPEELRISVMDFAERIVELYNRRLKNYEEIHSGEGHL